MLLVPGFPVTFGPLRGTLMGIAVDMLCASLKIPNGLLKMRRVWQFGRSPPSRTACTYLEKVRACNASRQILSKTFAATRCPNLSSTQRRARRERPMRNDSLRKSATMAAA